MDRPPERLASHIIGSGPCGSRHFGVERQVFGQRRNERRPARAARECGGRLKHGRPVACRRRYEVVRREVAHQAPLVQRVVFGHAPSCRSQRGGWFSWDSRTREHDRERRAGGVEQLQECVGVRVLVGAVLSYGQATGGDS